MNFLCAFIMLLARLCLCSIFLISAFFKITNYEATVTYMTQHGLPMVPILFFGATLTEILGGLSLLFGCKVRWGAFLLLLYLVPTTLIFHAFWNVPDAEKQIQQWMFLKNLAIFGGLLYVLASGAGGCSVDSCSCCKSNKSAKGNGS